MLTEKQASYAAHRARGLGKTAAARAAGYAIGSAKVAASKLERLPAVKAAIEDARQTAPNGSGAAIEYETAEDYLLAVVKGLAPPDPVRVGAARALLPFQRGKLRVPVRSATPREIASREALTSEQELLEAWAKRAAEVRERLKRERTG